MSDFASLADRLESIVEELDDMAFDRLRQASANGATQRPPEDKELTKARRAVEKAAHVLRNLDGSPSVGPQLT